MQWCGRDSMTGRGRGWWRWRGAIIHGMEYSDKSVHTCTRDGYGKPTQAAEESTMEYKDIRNGDFIGLVCSKVLEETIAQAPYNQTHGTLFPLHKRHKPNKFPLPRTLVSLPKRNIHCSETTQPPPQRMNSWLFKPPTTPWWKATSATPSL